MLIEGKKGVWYKVNEKRLNEILAKIEEQEKAKEKAKEKDK